MNKKRISIATFLLLLVNIPVFCQYYSTGADPANIKWREIRTANFQLIFPNDYEDQAIKLAGILEQVYTIGYQSLGEAPKKISVVIHSRTVNSNGMVAWAPRRMELYPTPHQKIYAQDWLDQLAVHEFRHVVQMNKIQEELPLIFRLIFGEQAAVAAIAAYVPLWFLEGDAVVSETALTQTGRGRNPYFLMENKAQTVEKGLYTYDKATLGSYKDYVPNRYNFGWWMVGGIRQKYGERVWADVLDRVARFPLSLNPVDHVLKEQTGMNKANLYVDLFSAYREDWKTGVDTLHQTPNRPLTNAGKSFTNYRYPHVLDDGRIIAYKESRDDIGRIVELKDGREQIVFTPGTILDESFSIYGNILIWAEQRPDLRWEHADKSVIVTFDLISRKKTEFRFAQNLFCPEISPSGVCFAAVQVDARNQYHLAIFNLRDGRLVKNYKHPQTDFFFSPCWSPDEKSLFFIGLSSKGKYIGKLNLETGQFEQLTSPVRYDIRKLHYHDQQILYTSAETGIDNIFSLDLTTHVSRQLTSVPFGADYGRIHGKTLYFSNYSANGYHLSRLDSLSFISQISSNKKVASNALADTLSRQEKVTLDFDQDNPTNYQSKPYRKLIHLFNFHSWAPAYINVNDYEVRPGISLLSQNKLGTAMTNLGYDYDWSERSGKVRANFDYTGLFPIIETEVGYGNRKSTYRLIQQGGDTINRRFSWNELSYELGVKIPLIFSEGKYSQLIQPELKYSYKNIIHDDSTPEQFYAGFYHSLSYRIYMQNVLRRSELDLLPKWGQAIELVYKQSPSGGTAIGDLKAIQTYLYFPGFYRNQGIRLYNGYQRKETDKDISFADVVRFPRGIQRIGNTDLYTFTADYMMPVCYPDMSISRFFYLKRLRASLFYDFTSLKGNTYNEDGSIHSIYEKYLTSFGLEVTGDGHLLRLPSPVSVGFRSIYLPDFSELRFELLLSVSFSSI